MLHNICFLESKYYLRNSVTPAPWCRERPLAAWQPTIFTVLARDPCPCIFQGAYEDELGEGEQWTVLQHALGEMGVQDERPAVSRVLSLVLLLGNLEFEDDDVSGTPHAAVSLSSRGILADAAHVAQCGAAALPPLCAPGNDAVRRVNVACLRRLRLQGRMCWNKH